MRIGTLKQAARTLAFVTGALCAGCGGSANKLSGSLSDIYNLDFDTVQAQTVPGFLVVEYLKGASQGKTLKLTVDLNGYTVVPNAEINLSEKAAGGTMRGTLQQILSTMTDLPLTSGGLTLDAVPTAGMHLGGTFHAVFSNPAGRTLDGAFSVDKVTQP